MVIGTRTKLNRNGLRRTRGFNFEALEPREMLAQAKQFA